MTDRELMQQALDALDKLLDKLNADICDNSGIWDEYCDGGNAMQALRARLAQPEPEPVAEVRLNKTGGNAGLSTHIAQLAEGYFKAGTKLYTTPPQREWQGLTDEEIRKLSDDCAGVRDENEFIRAIEQTLREKNT